MPFVDPDQERAIALIARERHRMIRRGEYEKLNFTLCRWQRQAQALGLEAVAELCLLLLCHNSWHFPGPGLLNDQYRNYEWRYWAPLAHFMTACHLNVGAHFIESFHLLSTIPSIPVSSQEEHLATQVLGSDLNLGILTWKFWNRNELLENVEIRADLRAVSRIKAKSESNRDGGMVQAMLALGVFYLNDGNYSTSLDYLQVAEHVAVETRSRMYPRVASALALVYEHLGNERRADVYFREANADIRHHFGPLGWQIRLAEFCGLRRDFAGAITRLQEIRRMTSIKGERGYNLWARIHEHEYQTKLNSETISRRGLLDEALALNMRRAYLHILACS
jgi:hypothetical protein